MNISKVMELLVPPILLRGVSRRQREAAEQEAFRAFYAQFIKEGDLCFDIGANLGNRVKSFRSLGCRVVAVEPQARCLATLRRSFAQDPEVVVLGKAAGSSLGMAELQVSSVHVLSSMSESFIRGTQESGRFAGVEWADREQVEVTTLDCLIDEYGLPRFLKIDVEGFESEVLAGLSVAVPAVSFEWTPELFENARDCVEKLDQLGEYEFNLSWGESMMFSRPEWRTAESMVRVLEEFRGESRQFGDVYARLKGA